jgi:hypothetical protein
MTQTTRRQPEGERPAGAATGRTVKWDATLISLFLSVYDGRQWTVSRTERRRLETEKDGGIDMLVVRRADGLRLAIEHTMVEPFNGERTDYYKHFKQLQVALREDESLLVPGAAIYVNFPIQTLPHGYDWDGIIAEVAQWLRDECGSFASDQTMRRCPVPHHPAGELGLLVRKQLLPRSSKSYLIIQRYGDMAVGDSVTKALREKLPKLTQEDSERRLLMLERDQSFVRLEDICSEIERRRNDFPALAHVDEVWIADTASFDETKGYVRFSSPSSDEVFEFQDGELFAMYRRGRPVPMPEEP